MKYYLILLIISISAYNFRNLNFYYFCYMLLCKGEET